MKLEPDKDSGKEVLKLTNKVGFDSTFKDFFPIMHKHCIIFICFNTHVLKLTFEILIECCLRNKYFCET